MEQRCPLKQMGKIAKYGCDNDGERCSKLCAWFIEETEECAIKALARNT